jgi:hypothetical protein
MMSSVDLTPVLVRFLRVGTVFLVNYRFNLRVAFRAHTVERNP